MKKERQQNSLQTDQEFLQNQIKKLNKKYKGSTYSLCCRTKDMRFGKNTI